MKTHPFSLLTINTWKGDGHYRQRLALLKTQLTALQPDVIAGQEVFRAEGADTGRELADALGMHYVYAPARHKPRLFEGKLTDSESGLGILSRFPILKTSPLPLPAHSDDGDRLAQFVWLRVNGTPVLVVNTHLTHLRGQSALRQRQLSAILTHPALENPAGSVFLCGDFNADAHSPEIRFLLTHPTLSVDNAYQLGNGTPPGHTMIDRSGNRRDRCIDFVFSLTTATRPQPTIHEAHVVLDSPDADGNYPSDHCGVLVRAELPAL